MPSYLVTFKAKTIVNPAETNYQNKKLSLGEASMSKVPKHEPSPLNYFQVILSMGNKDFYV